MNIGALVLQSPAMIASADFLSQIRAGRDLKLRLLHSDQDIQRFLSDVSKWRDGAAALIERSFESKECARDLLAKTNFPPVESLTERGKLGTRVVLIGNAYLLALARSHLDPEFDAFVDESEPGNFLPRSTSNSTSTAATSTYSPKVFIAHGRGDYNQTVARLIERVGLEPIILQEEPGGGRTIIEKIETYSDVGYAVVIMSPDDVGNLSTTSEIQQRARQNVIFELGYFVGRLGRGRVSLLYFAGVEIPSDYAGVEYISYDPAGAWRFKAAGELRHAGYDVDMNRITG